jgi:hypothetical protein
VRGFAAVRRNFQESNVAVFTGDDDGAVVAQVPPSGLPSSRASVMIGSPVTDTFFRSLPSKKPIHRLSGEKNGVRPAVTLDSSTASSWSSARNISRPRLW